MRKTFKPRSTFQEKSAKKKGYKKTSSGFAEKLSKYEN